MQGIHSSPGKNTHLPDHKSAGGRVAICRSLTMLIFMVLSLWHSTLVATDDWPMWRSDASRSAASNNALPSNFELLWEKQLPPRRQAWDDPLNLDLMTYDRVFEPIVLDGRIFIGFNDQDKLLAVDADTGRELWTFYTEAPVRLPPVGWKGRIYVTSDDGFLYCLSAEDGQLQWKFFGAPNSQHALGNKRLTSAWPARGGPVIYDDTVYFAASIWPFMGTFLYALNAETGELNWVNDSTGAQYIKQPHSAPSFAGVAPQGALVATDKWLIVPGGRSVPAVFDRKDGSLKYFEINAGGKGTGGSFVTADEKYFYVHTREKGTRAFDLESGTKTAFMPNEPVLYQGRLYSAEQGEDGDLIRAYDVAETQLEARQPLWELAASGRDDLILADGKLIAAGNGQVTIIELPTADQELTSKVTQAAYRPNETNQTPKPPVQQDSSANSAPRIIANFPVIPEVARLLVADQKLLAVSAAGKLAAYGTVADPARDVAKPSEVAANTETPQPVSTTAREAAKNLLAAGDAEGYAFWFGNANSSTLRALSELSPFEQLAVVDTNRDRIDDLRRELDAAGRLGLITGHVSEIAQFRPPQHCSHMVFVSAEAWSNAGPDMLNSMYQAVRPYGGVMHLLGDNSDEQVQRIQSIQLEQAQVEVGPQGLIVRRTGALPNSADWTHQYGDVANTIKSNDSRVRLPLGILWFGGSSNTDVLPRHGHGPPEQVVGGRLFIQGMNSLSARDVYTGRVLWKREFEDLGTFDVYFDDTYEDTPLNPQYNQVHIPGANGRGTNYVVTDDRLYLVIGDSCHVLDPVTGEDLDRIQLPEDEDGDRPEWGYVGVYKDILLGGLGFAKYRNRLNLQFEEDSKLSRSRAGFGSKSFDRAASRGLVAFDRHSGELLWQVDANHSFWHNGIVAGGEQVYCLDKNPTPIEEAMLRRGLPIPDSYRIVSFDYQTGKQLWEVKQGIFGTWLGYSEQHDLLLQAGAQASDRLYAEVGQGMRVYHAASGELKWKKDSLRYAGPCILHNDLILTNANSYSESAGAFFLETGQQKMVKNPLTGQIQPWTIQRAYGCNNIIASENMLTFRSGAAGYYDLLTDSGTGNLGGFKSGCTSNLVVANGVLNAPDYTRTCSCSYQNQTSLALVHMPEMELWSVNALANTVDAGEEIESLGINFGAPGDRRDSEGILWLEFPIVAGPSPALNISINPEAQFFQQHPSSVGTTHRDISGVSLEQPWILASGLEQVREVRIGRKIGNAFTLETGLPVSHADDDAEEGETGEVSLGSSDLELIDDGGNQIVGIRFTDLQVDRGAKIREAYVQFTCDEASSEPTALMIHGERSANSLRFASESHDISSRPATRAGVAWEPPAWPKPGDSGEAHRTPDLTRVIEEIISQDDWQPGNAISFIISGNGKRIAASSRGPSKDAARLFIITESPQSGSARKIVEAKKYDVDVLFRSPELETKGQVEFALELQGQVVDDSIQLNADDDFITSRSFSGVEVGNELHIRLLPKLGEPAVSGIRFRRSEQP